MNPAVVGAASGAASGLLNFIKNNWLLVLILVCLFMFRKQITLIFKRWSVNADLIDYNSNEIVKTNAGTVTVNVKQLAYNIYDSFYGRGWGMWEDETEAIKQLKKCPKSLVPNLADEYSRIGEKPRNLYEDFRRFLEDDDYSSIENYLH